MKKRNYYLIFIIAIAANIFCKNRGYAELNVRDAIIGTWATSQSWSSGVFISFDQNSGNINLTMNDGPDGLVFENVIIECKDNIACVVFKDEKKKNILMQFKMADKNRMTMLYIKSFKTIQPKEDLMNKPFENSIFEKGSILEKKGL